MIGKSLPRFLFAAALALLVVSCGRDDRKPSGYDDAMKNGTAQAAQGTVEMSDHQFKPREITIDAGEMVNWKNNSQDVHTVSADAEGAQTFHSGDIAPGASWTHTFSTPGTYSYVCRHHRDQGMTGRVIVRSPVK